MMTQCPKCGSAEIVPDHILFGDAVTGNTPPLLFMVDTKKKASGVAAGVRAAACGGCDHLEFYTIDHQDPLDAHKRGCVSQKPA